MPNLFRNEASDPLVNAQRNLAGRTHYVDDDTLRFHKSRVISTRHTDGGLLFAIVTSDALNYENTKRGYRYVIFDVFGTVISRCALEDAWSKRDRCEKAMWTALEAIDAKSHTIEAIAKARASYAVEMDALERIVAHYEKSLPAA